MPRHAGVAKEATAVKATNMTMAGYTRTARMAASPNTRSHTILTAGPIMRGSLTPASRSTSNTSSINNASTIAGKGIPSLWAAMLNKSSVGSIS